MKEELLAALSPHGQEHLLAFWDRLDDTRRRSLAEQIEAIDFAMVDRLYARRNDQRGIHVMADRAGSPPAFRLDDDANRFTAEQAIERGREALAAGHVGVILVAGGQGTRLGYEHPKGMFAIGPVSGRSLFQIHVEKIRAVAKRYGVSVPLYLMTSPPTHDETVEFFDKNDRFQLPEEDVVVFCQGTMPAIDEATGKILLAAPSQIAVSPDGHGGMLAALDRSGALADIRRRGIRQLFYFQVDNPLVDVCSPEFLGYHLLSRSELSSQVVAKTDPKERVGNVIEVDGRLRIIEYSDLPDDIANRRNEDGSLQIWAGSIAVHVMDVAMLQRMAAEIAGTSRVPSAGVLPFHFAHKKVDHLDAGGNLIEPEKPNAIKFERLIFDLLPSAENAIVVEVDPARGFAPLKNAPGAEIDTPEWVRAQMIAEHRRWLIEAGADVPDGVPVEICPLFATGPDQLREKIEPGTKITAPTYLCRKRDPSPKNPNT